MDSYDVLVIILSIALAIFLTLGIIALVFVIKILKKANKIADTVENVADNVENFSYRMTKVAAPIGIVKTIADIFKWNKSSK